MIFESKDEKIVKLEKKISDLEKKMETNLNRMNDSIGTLNEIILHLQTDNRKLRSEKDFLVQRHKKMLKRVPVPDLASEVSNKLVTPAKDKIKENVDFIGLVAKEGFLEIKEPKPVKKRKNPAKELKEHILTGQKVSNGKSIDKLFDVVSDAGRIRTDAAARKLGVHEIQVEEWGKILQEHDLVSLKKSPFGKLELIKI